MASNSNVYDKAKWHYDGDEYPSGLPAENGYTHIGFLLAWLLENGHLSQEFLSDHASQVQQFRQGEISIRRFCATTGEALISDMLTETGDAFAADYIDEFFLLDYELLFEDDYESVYEVEDNAQNFKKVARMLSQVYAEWLDERDSD